MILVLAFSIVCGNRQEKSIFELCFFSGFVLFCYNVCRGVAMDENKERFELGPIRPPSEVESLMLRVTRNCPWNNCTFCGLYKDTKFSVRSKDQVFRDIDLIKECVDLFLASSELPVPEQQAKLSAFLDTLQGTDKWAFHTARSWIENRMESVFLQDANTLVIKPNDLVEILNHLKKQFPHEKRITSYARSQTITRISDEDLKRIADAGLNRIHIGMESANDQILEIIKKGATKEIHIEGGQKVIRAGIQLSEYFMPGLGGATLSRENALDSADALNQIKPDFIRMRTLAVKKGLQLYDTYQEGVLMRATDIQVAQELLLFIESLEQMNSTIKSDHIINLLPEVEGNLQRDKNRMVSVLTEFLNLDRDEQILYQVGRRMGYMRSTKDLQIAQRRETAESVIYQNGITAENIDSFVEQRISQYI